MIVSLWKRARAAVKTKTFACSRSIQHPYNNALYNIIVIIPIFVCVVSNSKRILRVLQPLDARRVRNNIASGPSPKRFSRETHVYGGSIHVICIRTLLLPGGHEIILKGLCAF